MAQHIAIITVIYKNYTVLEDFLASLASQTEKNFHVIISDASPERKIINTHGLLCTILEISNKGYAHGVNEGVKKANELGISQYCVINDDVQVKADFTSKLAAAFESHKNSAFGGKIYYAKGFEYHQDRYTESEQGTVIWYAGGTVDWNHATTGHRAVDQVDSGQFDVVEETQFVTGCLFCFDKSILDAVGMWDETYFLYFEDADYSERIKKAKIPLLYDPTVEIWHKNAQSSDGSGSLLHEKLQRKSHLRFALKYAPLRTKLHVIKNYFLGR